MIMECCTKGNNRLETRKVKTLSPPKLGMSVLSEMTKRDVPGFAIGGLSGGESKEQFWKMVALSTSMLPKDKPRYLMGVGYVIVEETALSHAVGNRSWDSHALRGDPFGKKGIALLGSFRLLPDVNNVLGYPQLCRE